MDTRMRLNTANGEGTASQKLKLPLRHVTTKDTLIMKGCPNSLSRGKRCADLSFEWKSGRRPVVTSPGGHFYELNGASVFNTSEASSPSSKDPLRRERGATPAIERRATLA